jgi:hypothetical protein
MKPTSEQRQAERDRKRLARATRARASLPGTAAAEVRRLYGQAMAIETPTAAARKLPGLVEAWEDPESVRWGQPKGDSALNFAKGIIEQLAASSRCSICGRDLTDPDSIAKGIGPDCLAMLGGLPEWARTLAEETERLNKLEAGGSCMTGGLTVKP